jgi:thiamine biosynthesis protein ThiI
MRALVLLSGGIDSPVASKMLQENGHDVGAVHFSQEPFTDDAPEVKSRRVAEVLDLDGLWVSDAGERFGDLTRECSHALYFVLSKRLMLRAADRVAEREGFEALATGENLGQVSSQTLQNLACVHEAADRPVLTPLLALDKDEIMDLAREIGTYEISEGPEVCDTLGPEHPETAADLGGVLSEEENLDVDGIADEMADQATRAVPA